MIASFNLLPRQLDFVMDARKHPGFVGGYGAGKTRGFVMRALRELQLNHGVMSRRTPGVLMEPTYPMTRDILLPELEYWFDALGWPYEFNKTEKRLTVGDWGHLLLLSAENYTRHVGYNLCFFGVDEIDTINRGKAEQMWRVMCSRLRVNGSTGTGFVSGTPEGFGFMYDHWDGSGNSGRPDRDLYGLTRASARDNRHLPPEFVPGLMQSYDDKLARAYIDGHFVNLSGVTAAYQFDRAIHVQDREPSPRRWIGMDFNVDPLTAIVWSEYVDESIHAEREFVLRGNEARTETMARMLREAYPSVRDIYPDPAGRARRTSGNSDHQILRECGFNVIAHAAHPAVRDRLAALNRKLKDANGKVWLTVAPSCSGLIADLEQCTLDSSGELDKSDKKRTHLLDACSYGIEYKWPVSGRAIHSIGGLR